jgi:hypothetical protein
VFVRLAVQVATANGAETRTLGAAEDLVGQRERNGVPRPGREIEAVVLEVGRPQLVGVAGTRRLVLAALYVEGEPRVLEAAEAGTHEAHVELELEQEPGARLGERERGLRLLGEMHVPLTAELQGVELDFTNVAELLAGAQPRGAEVEDRHSRSPREQRRRRRARVAITRTVAADAAREAEAFPEEHR